MRLQSQVRHQGVEPVGRASRVLKKSGPKAVYEAQVRAIFKRLWFQLAMISNFDGRLRFILQHLGISKYSDQVFISSELGADKPDPEIFRRALATLHLKADEVLHVGDDPERDWKAAVAAGLLVFRLDRAHNSLRDLLATLNL